MTFLIVRSDICKIFLTYFTRTPLLETRTASLKAMRRKSWERSLPGLVRQTNSTTDLNLPDTTLFCQKWRIPRRPVTHCGSPTSTRTSSPRTWSGSQRRRCWPPGTSTATAPGRRRSSLRSKKKSSINWTRRER